MKRNTVLTINIYDILNGKTIFNKFSVDVSKGKVLSEEPIIEKSKWILNDNIIASHSRDKGFFMTTFQDLFDNTTNIHFVTKNYEDIHI